MHNNFTPGRYSDVFFPNKKVNPEQKDKAWHIKYAQNAYAYWYNNVGSLFGRGYMDEVDLLRAYGNGQQPSSIYKDMLLPTAQGEGEQPTVKDNGRGRLINSVKKQYNTIDFESIFSPMPKFKRLFKQMVAENDHDVDAETLDPESLNTKEYNKLRLYTDGLMNELAKEADAMMGINPANKNKYYPTSLQQLDFISQSGGFKLSWEMAMERVLDKSFEVSSWSEDIRDHVCDDLFDLNVAVVKDYFDKSIGAVAAEYVDVRNYIAQFDDDDGFSKSLFKGHVKYVAIDEIAECSEIGHNELRKIAKQSLGIYGNPNKDQWSSYDRVDGVTGRWKFYDFLVAVLDLEFKDIDYSYNITETRENGKTLRYRGKFGKESYENPNKKVDVSQTHTIRKVKWIIGTDEAYDFGHAKNIKRPNKKNVDFSFSEVWLKGPSLTRQAKPICDDIQLNYLNKQNALIKAPPPGIAIDLGAIHNLSIGKTKVDPFEIINIRMQDGTLFYKSTPTGSYGGYNPTKPFESLPGGIGTLFNEFIAIHERAMADLRELFGFTQPSSAPGTQDNEIGLGVSQMAKSVTDQSMFVYMDSYRKLKEKVANGFYYRLRSVLSVGENREKYNGKYPISDKDKVILEIPNDDWALNIKMRMRPNKEQKQILIQAIMTSLNANKDGKVGISQSQAHMAIKMVENGRLDAAHLFLAYCEDEEKVRQEALASRNIEQQSNAQRALQAQKDQGIQAKIKLEGVRDIEVYRQKKQIDLWFEQQKSRAVTIPEMAVEASEEASKGVNIDKN